MKAIIIQGASQTIELTEISGADAIPDLVGQASIIADEVDANNAVYFDEDCFIRGTEGRFQIDSLAPIAGVAVILGGSGHAATDTTLDPAAFADRVKFL